MKLASVLAAIVGLTLIGALVAHFGVSAVTRSLIAFGWTGFVIVCVIHLSLIVVMGMAWRALLPGTPAWVPIWGRLIRDSGSEVLPLSQVGGYVLGARAVIFAGASGTAATASTIVDVTLELFAQLAYTALSLAWLLYLNPAAAVVIPIVVGLAAGVVLAAAFLGAQRRGFDLLDRLARVLGRGWTDKTSLGAAALHAALSDIYRRRARIWISFSIHLACWVASTFEAWIALRLATVPLTFSTVLVIEGLLYAARSAAFAVPNAVGVQEGAYILLGAGFGLTPEMALALSLLKRARDLAIGVPALTACQLLETGRIWRRAGSPRIDPPRNETPVETTGVSAPVSWLR